MNYIYRLPNDDGYRVPLKPQAKEKLEQYFDTHNHQGAFIAESACGVESLIVLDKYKGSLNTLLNLCQ